MPCESNDKNGRDHKHIPERDLRCILPVTLLLAGDCLGATACADLAVCPAALGDIDDDDDFSPQEVLYMDRLSESDEYGWSCNFEERSEKARKARPVCYW